MASATPRNKLWATMNVSRTSREWKELQNPITSTVQIVKISNTALRLVMDFTITATMERVVVWPPEVISSTPLGEIRDSSGNWYPRDIGRSSILGDAIIFQFGDTFNHNKIGEFRGVESNTAALVDDSRNPTLSRNLQGWKKEFINLSAEEMATQSKIWSFSGIVEYETGLDGSATGWTWFQFRMKNKSQTGNMQTPDGQTLTKRDPAEEDWVIDWCGIAKVQYQPKGDSIVMTQRQPLRFGTNEPLLGSFCAIHVGGYIYVYGYQLATNKDVVVGRVKLHHANDKSKHEYLSIGNKWVPRLAPANCAIVFKNMVQGQVFETKMFGQEYPFAFIGCNGMGDSKILMGRARTPIGDWDIRELMGTYNISQNEADKSPFSYCMYVHPWASDEKKGDLCVSWSEGGLKGGVLANMIRLKTSIP